MCSVCFRLEIPFWDKFGPKLQNCLFKLKFGTETILNLLNLMVILNFSCLDQKYPFWGNLVQKIQNCLFNVEFRTNTNLNMWNSIMMLIFSVLYQKYPSWKNWSQIIKVIANFHLSCLSRFCPVFV